MSLDDARKILARERMSNLDESFSFAHLVGALCRRHITYVRMSCTTKQKCSGYKVIRASMSLDE